MLTHFNDLRKAVFSYIFNFYKWDVRRYHFASEFSSGRIFLIMLFCPEVEIFWIDHQAWPVFWDIAFLKSLFLYNSLLKYLFGFFFFSYDTVVF